MKRYLIFLLISVFVLSATDTIALELTREEKQNILDSLTTIDPEIRKYFPRWSVCEPDLQMQIYQTFVFLGYSKDDLDKRNVTVLAGPREYADDAFELLMITCGKHSINSVQIEDNFGGALISFLAGELYYSGPKRGEPQVEPQRDYCYREIPIEDPLSSDEQGAIIDYLRPTNVTHAITLSLFEQSLKIGETGYWLHSKIGNDEIGYHFWSSGVNKIFLSFPLYQNSDTETRDRIPFTIMARLGGAYRTSSGINDDGSIMSWVKNRTLNTDAGGRLYAGVDFHMPFHKQFGVTLDLEIPLKGLEQEGIDDGAYGYTIPMQNQDVNFYDWDPNFGVYNIDRLAPILRTTGQLKFFYHWWVDKNRPENYFKFDLGLNYFEIKETAAYRDTAANVTMLQPQAMNLKTYKPSEFGDWVYASVEYRNQAVYPFGLFLQYSNQMLFGKIYLPIISNWLYIEGKYSTPLRSVRPFEIKHFFMISPVIRLTI